MLDQFPKIRPPLPNQFSNIYVTHYKENRSGTTPVTSLTKKMESWMHRQVAEDVRSDPTHKVTLEIGAGNLNQLQYEPVVGPYDFVEPFKALYENSDQLIRIRNSYSYIEEIPVSQKYDRITSIATFEHICDLPEVIARACLLLAENGKLRVAIPSEGTFLWNLGWKLTTGIEFRMRYGLDYGILMRHEHVNTAEEIEGLLNYFFRKVKGAVFGLSKGISFYQFYECYQPEIDRCRSYLKQVTNSQHDSNV